MLVCFGCTAEIRDHLDKLVASGAYRNHSEAIEAAIRNLVILEKEVAEKGSIIIGGEAPSIPSPMNSVATPPASNGRHGEKMSQKSKNSNGSHMNAGKPGHETFERIDSIRVPKLFQLEGFPKEEPNGLADLPADMWTLGQKIPLDRWVLGQFNRLLPAKVNARALVRLFLDNSKGLEIASSASTIAGQAAVLGDYLRQLDSEFGVSRDDALATAFPSAEEGTEKGRTRYANQFVVYQNGKGELSGLMVDLKLINIVQVRKERRIIPTRTAWELAVLFNPLLDGSPQKPTEKFSAQERAFLTNHILRSVPVEAFAYRVILEAAQQEQISPEQIDTALKSYLDEERAGNLSQSFLASQRSGAVSRMSDLGLIERRREGVRMYYSATEEGLAFLSQCISNQAR